MATLSDIGYAPVRAAGKHVASCLFPVTPSSTCPSRFRDAGERSFFGGYAINKCIRGQDIGQARATVNILSAGPLRTREGAEVLAVFVQGYLAHKKTPLPRTLQ